jgi:hypothetical protein
LSRFIYFQVQKRQILNIHVALVGIPISQMALNHDLGSCGVLYCSGAAWQAWYVRLQWARWDVRRSVPFLERGCYA